MGKAQRKEYENLYSRARKSASAWDERLKTQEGAAEVLNIAPYTLGEYERGDVKVIPAERVADMAKAYRAPELLTDYCMNVCPIKGFLPLATQESGIQGITLRMILRFNENEIQQLKEELVEIAEDGIISEDEVPKMKEILERLERIAVIISEMKLAMLKSLGIAEKT